MNEKKIVKDSIKNHNYDDLKSAFDSMLSSSGVGDDDFEEVSTEELNEYIDGLECQAEDLRNKLAKANERVQELAQQNQQLLTYLEDAHSHIGHLAAHLAGRIADRARFEMATLADEWREYCEKLRKEQDDG